MTQQASNALAHITALSKLVDAEGCLSASEQLAPFLVDSRGEIKGECLCLLRPKHLAEVQAIIRYCHHHEIAIVPQGGNTNRVGGATPDRSGAQVILQMGRMNKIGPIAKDHASLQVQAGAILADIQAYAERHDRLFPLSLGAEGSCMIGGNIASNAGGIHVLRYGNCRNLVLGLEVVLADGTLWNGMRSLMKDNSGYDLKHLFIGSEGTLGLITSAVLKLFPRVKAVETAFIKFKTIDALTPIINALADDGLQAFELISYDTLHLLQQHFPDLSLPLSLAPNEWAILLEQTGQGRLADQLAKLYTQTIITDAVMANSLADSQHFWTIREQIVEAQRLEASRCKNIHGHMGAIKHDISVPISSIPTFVKTCEMALRQQIPMIRICAFGHVGDGNLHYNLVMPIEGKITDFTDKQAILNEIVIDHCMQLNGSFAAEHGVGQVKRDLMQLYKSPEELQMMRGIKHVFDPKGILNPNKLLP